MCLIYWIIWVQVISLKRLLSTEGCRQNSPSIFKDIIQIEVDPPPSHPILDKLIFDTVLIMLTSLPPSPRIFDKNHDKLGRNWAKLSYQLGLGYSLIKFCCITYEIILASETTTNN